MLFISARPVFPALARKLWIRTSDIALGLGLGFTSGTLTFWTFTKGSSFFNIFWYSFAASLTGILAIQIIVTFCLLFLSFSRAAVLDQMTPRGSSYQRKTWIDNLKTCLIISLRFHWTRCDKTQLLSNLSLGRNIYK